MREVCQSLGLSSPSTVHVHLKALEEKGLIKRDPLKSRSIALTYPLGDTEKRLTTFVKPSFNKVVNVPLVGNVAAGSPILAEEEHHRHHLAPHRHRGRRAVVPAVGAGRIE